MTGASEFSRLVAVVRMGREPLRQRIVASPEERAALARRLDLVRLDRLSAVVELARHGDGTILLTAEFAAAFEQSCVVTLDPVPGTIEESFALRYGPPEWEIEVAAEEEEPAFEPLNGDTIDIGEAVAQELALALPPFPRASGVSVETELGPQTMDSGEDAGPFAGLARLRGGREA